MNNASNQSTEQKMPLPILEAWLEGNMPSADECLQARTELQLAIDQCEPEAQEAVAELADLFTTLLDLHECMNAEFGEGAAEAQEINQFVQSHLGVFFEALLGNSDSNDCRLIRVAADERWGDHLALLFDDDSNEALFDETEDASDFDEQPSTQQIDAMLAAIGQSTSQASGSTTPGSDRDAHPSGRDTNEREAAKQDKTFEDSGTDLPKPPSNLSLSSEVLEDDELREAYLDDANRCLASMEQVVLQAEENSDTAGCVLEFCRQLHTLKGASASVGLSALANYLHEVEEWLGKNNSESLDIELLLSAVDSVRVQIGLIENPNQPSATSPEPEELSAAPKSTKSAGPAKPAPKGKRNDFSQAFAPGEASVRVRASQLDKLMDMLAELIVLRNQRDSQVGQLNAFNEELVRCSNRLGQFRDEHMDTLRTLTQNGSPESDVSGSYIGSEPTTVNAISEVTSDLSEISRGIKHIYKPIAQENQALSSFIRHFRQELIQLRRVPLVGLFQKLTRSARDAAKVESRNIQVKLVGQNIGLEQTLQEQLYDPLLHLVRNAVGHGIEDEEVRRKNGKNPVGTITLEAKASANLLVISIVDDGKGLDYDALRRRGFERGLLSPDRSPTTRELANLIFHPGFSTRDKASEVAGRGIGMDVVAGSINQLQGRIEIDSHPGSGTTMRVSIPLKSGIEHTMVFRSNGQLFALPMQSVASAQRQNASSNVKEETRYVELSQLHGLVECDAKPGQQQIHLQGENGNSEFAIVVDEIIGPEEVVVRSLPRALFDHPYLSGLTLSGEGEVVLLVDGSRIANLQAKTSANETPRETTRGESIQPTGDCNEKKVALVVDDSISARKVLVKRLRRRGFETEEAGDGVEALEQLRRRTYDIMFTDIDMPRLSGIDLLADINENNSVEVTSVVVSNRNQEKVRERVAELGAVAFINKPVTDEGLDEVFERILETKTT